MSVDRMVGGLPCQPRPRHGVTDRRVLTMKLDHLSGAGQQPEPAEVLCSNVPVVPTGQVLERASKFVLAEQIVNLRPIVREVVFNGDQPDVVSGEIKRRQDFEFGPFGVD